MSINAQSVLDLIRKVEWSARCDVSTDDGDYGSDPLSCCPLCHGFEAVPDTVTVGDELSGWDEREIHPDHYEDEGHRPGCVLKMMIDDLEAALKPRTEEPDRPLPDPEPENVVSLDAHRVRVEREFEDESVAYVEALWGKETFGYNAAIRDLEGMRRGQDGGSLRPPQTYHEAYHLVMHVRALANDLARHFQVDALVRPDDDLE